MLEKHLGHLKKSQAQIEGMPGPPPPLAQVAAKNSLKAEESPATSPATVSNWTSPGNTLGMSPANSEANEYSMAVPPGPYHMQPGMAPPGMPSQVSYGGSPGGMPPRQLPPGIGPQPIGAHRRQISDISGGPGDLGSDVKRQQMFGPGPQHLPPHMGPGVPMGQPMQNPLNPMHRRPG